MTSLCFLWEIIHSDFIKYLHQKIFRPSIQAIVIIYSGKLLSLSEQAAFSFRADYIHSPTYQIPQEKTQEQAKSTTFLQAKAHSLQQNKAHNLSTSKPTTFPQAKPTTFLQAKSTAILQAKAHSHTTSLLLKKTLRKQANPAKYPQYSTL